MSDPVRVLLCHADGDPVVAVAGRALVHALGLAGAQVRSVDLRAAVGPAPLRRVAELLGRLSAGTLSSTLVALGGPRFGAELAASPPDVLVALDAVAAEAVLEWRRRGRLHAPILGVALDLEPLAWKGVDVDRVAVVDEAAAEALGVAGRGRAAIVGVIASPEVAAAAGEDRVALKARFGVPAGRRLLLLDARDLDHDLLGAALTQLGLLGGRAELVCDAGADGDTAAFLRAQAAAHGLTARMFGDIPEAPLLWRAADLCVVPAAREPLARGLALGAVLVVLASPDDAGGLALGRAVEARGVGLLASSVHRLGATLELALHEARFERAQAAAARPCPEAAADTAALVLALAAERPKPAAEAGARPARETPAGGLEEIGAGVGAPRPPTADEVKARLVAVEASAAQARRRLEESERELARWDKRAALAARRGAAALAEAAHRETETYRRAVEAAGAEIARLGEERARLEVPAVGPAAAATGAGPRAAALEADYRRMEIEDELAALKDKLGKPRP